MSTVRVGTPSKAPLAVAHAAVTKPPSTTRLAWRRLRRDRIALLVATVLGAIVLLCLLAPLFGHLVGRGPNDGDPGGTIVQGGSRIGVLDQYGIPIGPTWHRHFFLGADLDGRDVALRALYGGRNSLEIGLVATLISLLGGTALGLLAGYFRGATDALIARLLDIIWAFPANLLGIALGVTLAVGGLSLGPLHVEGGSNFIPAIIVGVIFIPYIARPVRGEVMGLRQSEFVDAARMLGYGHVKIMRREILPNLSTLLVPFVALQFAQSIVLEASLSFLGAGVQPPNASWGTMLGDGVSTLASGTSLHLTIVPCAFLIVSVFSANVLAQRVRLAFDPNAAAVMV